MEGIQKKSSAVGKTLELGRFISVLENNAS